MYTFLWHNAASTHTCDKIHVTHICDLMQVTHIHVTKCRYAPDVNHVPDDFTADFLARRESYSDVRRWEILTSLIHFQCSYMASPYIFSMQLICDFRSLSLTSIGVQTDCRESEVQTEPFTPEVDMWTIKQKTPCAVFFCEIAFDVELNPGGSSSARRRHRPACSQLAA